MQRYQHTKCRKTDIMNRVCHVSITNPNSSQLGHPVSPLLHPLLPSQIFLWVVFFFSLLLWYSDIQHCIQLRIHYNNLAYVYSEMTAAGLVYILHFMERKRKKKVFSLWGELWGSTLRNFQIYHTVVLNIVTILYITFLVLTDLVPRSLYLLTAFIQLWLKITSEVNIRRCIISLVSILIYIAKRYIPQ